MYFRYRHRERFTNASDDDVAIDYIIPTTQDNYRFNIQYPVGPSIRLRNRIEYSQYQKTNSKQENGFVIWQEITFKNSVLLFLFLVVTHYSKPTPTTPLSTLLKTICPIPFLCQPTITKDRECIF